MSEATQARVRYLIRQRGTLTYKRDVPGDLRQAIGRTQWWIALKAKSMSEAEAIVNRIAREHDKLIADLRAMTPTQLAGKARQRVAQAVASIQQGNSRPATVLELLEALVVHEGLDRNILLEHAYAQGTVAVIDSAASGVRMPTDMSSVPVATIGAIALEKARLEASHNNAVARLAEIEDTLSKAGFIGEPEPPPTLTVSMLTERWLAAEAQRPVTRDKWVMIMRRFAEHADDPPVANVTRNMLATFIDAVKQLPSPATHTPKDGPKTKPPKGATFPDLAAWASKNPDHPRIAATTTGLYVSCLKALFGWAAERELIPVSPATHLRKPEDRRSRSEKRRPFERPELRRIVEEAERVWGPKAPRTVLLKLAAYTGLRLGELVQLTPSNVEEDAEAGLVVHINAMDGRLLKTTTSERTIPVHLDIADLLREHKAGLPSGKLFLFAFRAKDKDDRADSLGNAFRYLVRTNAGITDPTVTFHSIRHSFEDEARRTIPDAARHALTGHGEENRTARGYGRGMRVADLRPLVDAMDPLGLRSVEGR